MTDSTASARGFVARARGLATLLAALAGLVTAVGAYRKPRDDSATKAAYETLAVSIDVLSDEHERMAARIDVLERLAVEDQLGCDPPPEASSTATSSPRTYPSAFAEEPTRPTPRPEPVRPPSFDTMRQMRGL